MFYLVSTTLADQYPLASELIAFQIQPAIFGRKVTSVRNMEVIVGLCCPVW